MAENTYRTILFEEFDNSDNAKDLRTILENAPDNAAKEKGIKELTVHSYDELLSKFTPKVYQVWRMDGTPLFTTDYNKVKNMQYTEVNITKEKYYNMLLNLYIQKGTSGQPNAEFNDSEILEMLTPSYDIQEVKKIRKALKYNWDAYYEAEGNGEDSSKFAENFVAMRHEITDVYQGNILKCLPIRINDIKGKMELLSAPDDSDTEEENKFCSYGQLTFDNTGNLIVAPLPVDNDNEETKELPYSDDVDNEKEKPSMRAVILTDYEENTKNQNEFVRELILDTYAPLDNSGNFNLQVMSSAEIDEVRQELTNQLQITEKFYKTAQESFINVMHEIIDKLIGVYVMFDHATADGRLEDGIIVSNCKVSALINGQVKNKFEDFMRNRGKVQAAHKRLWFAVIPDVTDGASPTRKNAKVNIMESLKSSAAKKKVDENRTDIVTLSALKSALEITKKSQIMTVIGFKSDERSTFENITVQYIKEKKKQLSDINSAYATYAYPNFKLTRMRKIPISNEIAAFIKEHPELASDDQRISIPNSYVNAAYVAAGMLIGSQQIGVLKKAGFKDEEISKNMPLVRIDLGSGKINKRYHTKFNRENKYDWDELILSEIVEDNFGFVFCGNELSYNGNLLKNTYVYNAATLEKSNRTGKYRPIDRIMLTSYIYARSKVAGSTKEDVKKEFMTPCVDKWAMVSKGKDRDKFINLMIKEGDSISLDEASSKVRFNVSFAEEDEKSDVIEINMND